MSRRSWVQAPSGAAQSSPARGVAPAVFYFFWRRPAPGGGGGRRKEKERGLVIGAMESFITADGAVVHVPVRFIERHMNNGVVPRLLGWDMADGLTTPKPSRNKDGHIEMLVHMQIGKVAFVKLLQFLRLGQIPSEYHQMVYDASISLGGLDALDAYLMAAQQEAGSREEEDKSDEPANPMNPREDVQNRYRWTTQHMNIHEVLQQLTSTGWSVTDLVEPGGMHVYLRLDTSV